jgi:hypothetical protein
MGDENAPVGPEESVRGTLALVERFEDGMSGEFFLYRWHAPALVILCGDQHEATGRCARQPVVAQCRHAITHGVSHSS